jgi:predicted Rdx family selenoprotein
LTEQILAEREIEYFIKDWKLIPAVGGKFEVTVNDELVFSKKGLGRHAEDGEVRTAIMKKLDTLRPADFKLPVKD